MRGAGDVRWNGSAYGYRAFLDHDAASGITVALAGNIASGAIDRIREALPRIAAGEEVDPPEAIQATAVAVELEILAGYLGTYELRPGTRFELELVDGQLRMSDWLLIPTSATTFFSPQDYGEIEVVKGDDGEVRAMDWKVGGQTYPMPRVAGPAGD